MFENGLPSFIDCDENGICYLVHELCLPLRTGENLSGIDCPAEKCSVCGSLFEEGANFYSWCGRVVVRNGK